MKYEDLTLEEYQGIKERCQTSNTGEFNNGVTIYKCPICQKDFAVMYVSTWTYKRKTRARRKNELVLYMCSYGCARIYDRIFEK